MENDFNPGDYVVFRYNGELRYLRITKIVMTPDGLRAVFAPGCACKAISMPLDQLYRTKEELKKAEEI